MKVTSRFFGDSAPSHLVGRPKFGALVGRVKVGSFFCADKIPGLLFIGYFGADLEGMMKVMGSKIGQKSPHMKVIQEFRLREMT